MDLKCDFCDRQRSQVGQLSCGHQMCASCFPCLASQLERCYLCILKAAQVKRSALRVLHSDSPVPASPQNDFAEKMFCSNEGCDFIATGRADLLVHLVRCKFQSLSGDDTESLISSSSSNPTSTPTSTPTPLGGAAPNNHNHNYSDAAEMATQASIARLSSQVDQLSEQILDLVSDKLDLPAPAPTPATQHTGRGMGFFEIAATAVIAAFVVNWYYANQDISMLLREGSAGDPEQNSVRFAFASIDDLASRARFNKRDLILSEELSLQQYKVKLGMGASMSTSENVVNLWLAAVVTRGGGGGGLDEPNGPEVDWPQNEVLRLTLHHDEADRERSFDFVPAHKGTWKESVRVHRGQLVYRQMQVDTTKRVKYIRFASLLSFEEAAALNYIQQGKLLCSLTVINQAPI